MAQTTTNPLQSFYYGHAMVHTFTNVCKRNLCKVINLWHEKPNNRHVKPGN
ncbi:hypothetical protein UUU_08740 [Klebsiella pneumoniae subsp. pneumoniae DSM 30104 = JCM 1662 = NBRC 14940]|nr:hypothetical protein UUU_08740 [Klebsiella pneumoniae subsp. pneumoniae DSM 30104 = JCM 1662 = NBRC 14940]